MALRFSVVLACLLLSGAADAGTCLEATRPLQLGMVPSARDFRPVACADAKTVQVLRYDEGIHAFRLLRNLASGDTIEGPSSSFLTEVVPGDKLYLTVQVGPVLVQREVEALQPARLGETLFVRALDGRVMTALLAEGAPR